MKRFLFLFVILLVIITSLSACGGKDDPPSNDGNGGAQEHIHNFLDWDVVKNPTCSEDGAKVRYCACGEKQNEIIVALGHTPAEATIENRVDATCEADGSYIEVVYCSTCKEKLSETAHTIPMLKHTPEDAVEENRIDATCYSTGSYDMVVYCSDCGAELEKVKHTIAIVEHTPATAVEENRIEPTFDKDGSYDMVVYCSASGCGAELERTTHPLDMFVHHPGNKVIENEVAATCTSTGSYDEVVYCLDSDCGHKELSRKTVTTPKTDHTNSSAVKENRVNATCYREGSYDSVVYCSVCKTELSRSKITLQKTAHSSATAVVENEVAATCTTAGSYDEVVYCSVENCKTQISRTAKTIDAIGHTEVIDPGVDATCTTTGLTEGKHCFVCGETTQSQTVVAKAKHDFVNEKCAICDTDYYSEGLKFTSNGDGTCYVSGIGNCTDTDIVIPRTSPLDDRVTAIGKDAFIFCSNLTSLVIGDGVTSIGDYAFAYCSSITSVVIGDRVAYIGAKAFLECKKLKSVIIGSNVTHIYGSAFYDCINLELVVIPKSIKFISNYAFYGLSKLNNIYYTGNEDEWNTISIDDYSNHQLINTSRYYYSEKVPTTEGNFWNWVDGVPTPWPEYVAPYVRDGNYIYFGEYPQTIKADYVTITKTQDSRGYYLGSDGSYYAKITAKPYTSGYTFSTGTTINSGTIYYFKVEPIRWRILSEENGEAFILCDSIIDSHRFDDDSNNYAESEIRAWLNDTFYETAFSTLQQAIILTTEVDNSAVSTGYDDNPDACENTLDKVFLLSSTEATNSYYGFRLDKYELDVARRMLTSDYSRASGMWIYPSSSYYGGGYWWLRSPYAHISTNALAIGAAGSVVDNNFIHENGIVPALRIRL